MGFWGLGVLGFWGVCPTSGSARTTTLDIATTRTEMLTYVSGGILSIAATGREIITGGGTRSVVLTAAVTRLLGNMSTGSAIMRRWRPLGLCCI